MNIIKIKNQKELSYPTGRYIEEAIAFIKNLSETIKDLDDFNNKSIKIWCRGSSGAMLASMLSIVLMENNCKVFICYVRKDEERSHGYNSFCTNELYNLNIIIDDFIASGETICDIASKMRDAIILHIDYIIVSGVPAISRSTKSYIQYPMPKNLIVGCYSKTGYAKYMKPTNLLEYDFTR